LSHGFCWIFGEGMWGHGQLTTQGFLNWQNFPYHLGYQDETKTRMLRKNVLFYPDIEFAEKISKFNFGGVK
jgi:hypothetical protein